MLTDIFGNRKWLLAVAVVLALALGLAAGSAEAQTGDPWQALYWNDVNFSGEPAQQRQEASLTHRWGEGSPAPGIVPDRFSARWTNNVALDAGTYRFTTVSDDGIRVWVDEQLLIDNWTVHAETEDSAVTTLSGGDHHIRVDYFENTGEAVAVLQWEQLTEGPDGDPGREAVTISPLQGPVGTVIDVEAIGFPANTEVSVGLGVANAEPTVAKQVMTNDEGIVQTTITLPPGAEVGEAWRVLVLENGQSALSGDFTVTAGDGAAPSICGDVYIVRPGDWLSRIAERCNTTVDALLAANPTITDPSLIHVGQRLVLPGSSNPAEPAVGISPTSGPVGTTVAVNASGFAPDAELTVGIGRRGAEPAASKRVTANERGAVETTIAVPPGATTGEPWVVLVRGAGESALSNTFTVTRGAITATTQYNLRLRAGPSTDTDILDVVPNGTTLEVRGRTEDGDWIRVTYAGQTGWMARRFTTISGDLSMVPVQGRFTTANVYLIALGDAGQSGPQIGCDDSVVPVQVQFAPTQAPLTAALQQLLAIDEQFYGQSGLYNALYNSNLSLQQVAIENGTATIRLSGELQLGGACDNPRVEAQLRQTALQFDTVDEVDITLNGQPLQEVLSGQ